MSCTSASFEAAPRAAEASRLIAATSAPRSALWPRIAAPTWLGLGFGLALQLGSELGSGLGLGLGLGLGSMR